MPLVHIDLVEGRSPEQVVRMIRSVSEAVAASLDAPIDSVRVVVNEVRPNRFGVGGRLWPEVAERRRAAQPDGRQPG